MPVISTTGEVMKFSVDAWDVGYGSALTVDDLDLPESIARVQVDVEFPADKWAPIAPSENVIEPSAVLFVDGVRRIDARVWIDDPIDEIGGHAAATASMAVCASYAAGVVCCCGQAGNRLAHLLTPNISRGLFTIASHARDITTRGGPYRAHHTAGSDAVPLAMTLSNALQQALAGLEMTAAVEARVGLAGAAEHTSTLLQDGEVDDDLLVIDGPLRNHAHLPRALGLIKTHRAGYLPSALNGVVAALNAGQRSPAFLMGSTWERYAWYLRLPSVPNFPGAPWAGVVRCEATTELSQTDLTALANLSQTVLCRYASTAYKDSRAPQNLVPIGGLEDALRHRLGDARIMYRALREAASG